MSKQNLNNEEEVYVFFGFWKYLGVFASFILGIILFWWGINIFINDFFILYKNVGFVSYILLSPLALGCVLTLISFSEFLAMIKEE